MSVFGRAVFDRSSRSAAVAILLCWIFPASGFADAILTSVQPDLGDFGAAALVEVGDGVPTHAPATQSDPVDLAKDIIGNRTGQTVASTSLTVISQVPNLSCIGFCGASASGSANLADGTLRFSAMSTIDGGGALAQASLFDTISALADGVEHFDVTFSGNLTGDYIDLLQRVDFSPRLLFRVDSSASGGLLPNEQFSYDGEGGSLHGGAPSCFTADLTVVRCTLGFDVILTKDDPTTVTMFIEGSVADNVNLTMNFADTIRLAATGVDFTSASGVFLTQAATPEPGTLALLGIGLAGLGFSRRKHSAAA